MINFLLIKFTIIIIFFHGIFTSYASSFSFEEKKAKPDPKKVKQIELINKIDEKLKIDGERVLLILDVSASTTMKDAFEEELLQTECIQVINKIFQTSQFGIVIFRVNLNTFSDQLVAGSADQKEAASCWIKNKFKKSGVISSLDQRFIKNPYGFAGVLEYAASLKPDTLIVLSDGNYNWKYDTRPEQIPWNEIRRFTNKKLQENGGCKISFIALQPKDDDRRQLISISSSTKGQFLEIK